MSPTPSPVCLAKISLTTPSSIRVRIRQPAFEQLRLIVVVQLTRPGAPEHGRGAEVALEVDHAVAANATPG